MKTSDKDKILIVAREINNKLGERKKMITSSQNLSKPDNNEKR